MSASDNEARAFARKYFNQLPDDCRPVWIIYSKQRHEYLGYVPVRCIQCDSKYGRMTYVWFGSNLLFSHLGWAEYDWSQSDCARV